MTIRKKVALIVEVVARTVAETELADWSADNYTQAAKMEHGGDCTKEPYSCPRCYAEEIQAAAHAAITAFLAAAAEPDEQTGISWHMRSDEVTADMKHAAFLAMDNAACRGDPKARAWDCVVGHRAMLAAAPEFEWDR